MLGAEQSGFIADLGYETYQKILREAVHELKHDEFQELLKEQERVEEIPMPRYMLPNVLWRPIWRYSFRKTLCLTEMSGSAYRELDSMERETDIQRFRERLQDRFGRIPQQAMELIRLVTLRRIGRSLGGKDIPQSRPYEHVLRIEFGQQLLQQRYLRFNFGICGTKPHMSCRLQEDNDKRSLQVNNVPDVENAIAVLNAMLNSGTIPTSV